MTKIKDKALDVLFIAIVGIATAAAILPFFNIIALSLSDPGAIMKGDVVFLPVGMNFEAYKTIFNDNSMRWSMVFTILLTLGYMVIALFMTICLAYPLTKKRLYGRKVFMVIVVFTMYFTGGIIPEYILFQAMGITNTVWVLILPCMISAYNMIILKSFFGNLPASIEESAYLDGASDIYTLFHIVLPLSKPVLATLLLFYAVTRWNMFQDALYFITDSRLYPLQLKLNMLINITQTSELTQFEGANVSELVPESVKSASIIFTILPIICVYPWLQRYFVTGVVLGAVKE